jgi:uncharacterized membrane protein YdjX (TVP38/TMEM64 family)
MKKSSYIYTFLFIFIFLLTLAIFYWFIKSVYFIPAQLWVSQNRFSYIVILFLCKALGIIWPPIPSGLLTMGSIPFLGWKTSYFIDLGGSIAGGTIAYYLAKRYGLEFLKKIFDQSILERIQKTKIKKGKEIEAVFVYRVLLGTTILEAIYYGAGLLKVTYWKFLIGAVLSHLVVGIPTFILAQNIFSGKNMAITVLSIVVSLFIVYKTKSRYFE